MMSNTCPNPIDGFGFSREEIAAAVARRGLLSIEIEFSLACNFNCIYCYNTSEPCPGSMTSEEIDNVLMQAKELGARRIIILGGEPMIYPHILDKIGFIREHGMEIELFTNGSCITAENARFMFSHDVAMVLKFNSFKPEIQNYLAGRSDAHNIIWSALENLFAAGYPSPGKRLAASAVISSYNYKELPDIWRWMRQKGIEPYVEMITPQGNAKERDSMDIPVEEHRKLFEKIAEIDRKEFGHEWDPQPPLVGNRCLRHQFSCLITARGEVHPCVGVTIPVGNIREESLRQILDKSEVLENLRDFPNKIKEPCAACEKAQYCYGCRGAAYQLTGDYLASDPMCWFNQKKNIERLPAKADAYLPHTGSARIIEELVSVGERCAELRLRVPDNGRWVDEDGVLDETAFVEIVAQATAVLNSFHKSNGSGSNAQGYLLGAKGFEIIGQVQAGQTLDVYVRKIGRLGEFGIVEGTISRNGQMITRGEVNVYQKRTQEESNV